MRTIFNNGFKRSPWERTLGQNQDPYAPTVFPWETTTPASGTGPDWGSLITTGITSGTKAYGSYTQGQIAEDTADAAQARADAARAAADAERARAAAAAAKAGQGGIPTGYLILGGLGLVAAIVTTVVLSK